MIKIINHSKMRAKIQKKIILNVIELISERNKVLERNLLVREDA